MDTLIAYIPVIHSGHSKLFEECRGSCCYLVDPPTLGFIEKFPYLGRETRALDVHTMQSLVQSMDYFDSVEVLSVEHISAIKESQNIVMADEDATRWFAQEYLHEVDVQFKSWFLRWDWDNAPAKEVVVPDVCVSKLKFDKDIIKLAYGYSERSSDWWRQIGAVVVKDGEVIYWGYNEHSPSPHTPYINGDTRTPFLAGQHIDLTSAGHAEAKIIAHAAGLKGGLDGSWIYVTTFPCPGCAISIINAGIKRVYFCEGYSLAHAAENLKACGVEIIQVVL